ncbi:MAG TPA: hypothetical protein VK137_17265, partial [Planctomycetaceae bacterium]|nr:hypothetical protein [Planctomycetaceae bacterium]
MDEPLFDGLTAVSVLLGAAAAVMLQSDGWEVAAADRAQRRRAAGHVLLGLCLVPLLSRWVGSVLALPPEFRPGWGRCGAMSVACGAGIVAAIKLVTTATIVSRVTSFLVMAGCGMLALIVAAAWEWALLWLTLLAAGTWTAMWTHRRARAVRLLISTTPDEASLREQTHLGADSHRSLT